MAATIRHAMLEQLAARLDALEQEVKTLRQENARLREPERAVQSSASPIGVAALTAPGAPGSESPRPSRRGILKLGLGAAATLGTGALLETTAGTAAASSGNPVVMGVVNQEEGS